MPYSDPKFPVVNNDPSVDDCINSLRKRDYMALFGLTGASWGYGYMVGKPLRGATASTAAAIGFTFASFVVLQDTRSRLLGYKENGVEVKKYGLCKIQPSLKDVEKDSRFPHKTGLASPEMKPPLDWKNYN
uniref:NADH-ubiquinone oxidoreductase 21kDa subunit N-terminal domain-containing protein n=1 Tax=Ditylum brightwellii TaxID=49249 RepID=A0A6V2QQX1_9STRA|mmetsp:Transcript_3020/g.4160  ORF Transcript_3020/g.4160 Transcript_3020/m.4160 type:complete len:131 (+) Transcript_3020:120-512(+)